LQLWIFTSTAFIEGDQEEYRWFVPHDLPGLMGLFKSPANYVQKLNTYFELSALDKLVLR
jgi:putative alpha-1,2-mannosidase